MTTLKQFEANRRNAQKSTGPRTKHLKSGIHTEYAVLSPEERASLNALIANYYARFDGSNVPLNHTLIKGAQVYLSISLNHRWVYVKSSDVTYV